MNLNRNNLLGVDCIQSTRDRVKWSALVNTALKLLVP
jgi:hypothetical protein